MIKIGKAIVDILYPARCPLCEKILPGLPGTDKKLACQACVAKLKFITGARCMKCGKQLYVMEQEYCEDCLKRNHVYDRGVAAVAYSDEMKQSMHRFKYKCRREYAPFYARLIERQCGSLIKQWNVDVIIPVPMFRHKQRVRGYNQAELIALELSKLFNIEINSEILIRSKKTRAMKELNDVERSKNLQNAFKLNKSMIKYRHILLVDDIYTTGSTIDACTTVLKQGGALKVYYVSLCIGSGF